MAVAFASANAVLLLCLSAADAWAQAETPTDDQYDPALELIGAESGAGAVGDPGGAGGGVGDPSGALPFTGLDLFAIAAVAVALVAFGLLLRRQVRGSHAGR